MVGDVQPNTSLLSEVYVYNMYIQTTVRMSLASVEKELDVFKLDGNEFR